MTSYKAPKQNFLNTKSQWWSKRLIWIVLLTIGVCSFGCKKDQVDPDEYYIKYEVNSSTIYMGGKLNVVIMSEDNQNKSFVVPTRSSWEVVIGPVKKGFNATLTVTKDGNSDSHLKLNSQISVSKNGSPFTLKEIDSSDVPRNSVQLKHKIDF